MACKGRCVPRCVTALSSTHACWTWTSGSPRRRKHSGHGSSSPGGGVTGGITRGAEMARLPEVSERDAGFRTRIAYYFMKRQFKRLTGRDNESMLGPIRVYAHIPKLLAGYGKLEQTVAKVHLLDLRHRALAELKAATTTRCEYCIDMGSRISRDWGLTDEELLALPNYRAAACFSDVDKLVLDYAAAMSRTPAEVSDELFA